MYYQLLLNFNSIKVQLRPSDYRLEDLLVAFQFHKGTIKTILMMCLAPLTLLNFNSIKVQLRPIALGYIISLFPIGFAGAKLRNLIEKMSMGNYVFLGVLRQPLYLFVLQ